MLAPHVKHLTKSWRVEFPMGLFDQIAGAIANPNQLGNPDQLSSILGTVQQLSGNYGVDPATSQQVMSMVGGYVRSALQQQQAQGGSGQVESILNQFSGLGANPSAVQALFPNEQQAQVSDAIAQHTGLPSNIVQSLLPALIPVVLNMLQTGASQPNTQSAVQGGNSVLSAFLDSDQDGDVDLGDAMAMAGRYLQSR
jgi:Bacterial protein of unknown function (DUF937)